MTEPNGSYVSRAELMAHIKGIDQRFQDVSVDISEIKWGVNSITETLAREKDAVEANRKSRWRTWGPPIVASLLSASIASPIALLIAYSHPHL